MSFILLFFLLALKLPFKLSTNYSVFWSEVITKFGQITFFFNIPQLIPFGSWTTSLSTIPRSITRLVNTGFEWPWQAGKKLPSALSHPLHSQDKPSLSPTPKEASALLMWFVFLPRALCTHNTFVPAWYGIRLKSPNHHGTKMLPGLA